MFSLAPRSSLSSNQTRVAAAPIRAPEKTSCQILKFKGWGFGWLLAGWGASREKNVSNLSLQQGRIRF
jgi:hypothetical protein